MSTSQNQVADIEARMARIRQLRPYVLAGAAVVAACFILGWAAYGLSWWVPALVVLASLYLAKSWSDTIQAMEKARDQAAAEAARTPSAEQA